jgi:hypothetical protein
MSTIRRIDAGELKRSETGKQCDYGFIATATLRLWYALTTALPQLVFAVVGKCVCERTPYYDICLRRHSPRH